GHARWARSRHRRDRVLRLRDPSRGRGATGRPGHRLDREVPRRAAHLRSRAARHTSSEPGPLRSHVVRRVGGAVLALALLVGLGACGGGDGASKSLAVTATRPAAGSTTPPTTVASTTTPPTTEPPVVTTTAP